MRIQPDITPSTVASPMQTYVTAAIRQSDAPRRQGVQQSDIHVAVVKGQRHPAVALDRILMQQHAAGASLGWALNVVRALRQSVLTVWGGLPNAMDPTAAHFAETDAECDTNRLQARVFANITAARDCELDALLVALDIESARTEGLMLTLDAEKLRRQQAESNAMRRLGVGA